MTRYVIVEVVAFDIHATLDPNSHKNGVVFSDDCEEFECSFHVGVNVNVNVNVNDNVSNLQLLITS